MATHPIISGPLRNMTAFVHDIVMAGLSFLLAVYIRLGDEQLSQAEPYLLNGALIAAALSGLVFSWMRLYRGLWRYASLEDMANIIKAVTLAIGLFYLFMFQITRLEGFPRSVMYIQWGLMIGLLAAPRLLYRALKDGSLVHSFIREKSNKTPILLIGAGDNAEQFIREQLRSRHAPYQIVGVIDDNSLLHHRNLHGVRIYGGVETIPKVMEKLARKQVQPRRIIVTDHTYDGEKLQQLLKLTESLGVALGRLPRLSAFEQRFHTEQLITPIAVEDVLGRPQRIQNTSTMRESWEGKTILITGAGGTIGSELCRQVAQHNPSRLLLVEQSEYALYQVDAMLARQFPHLPREALLGDVRQKQWVDHLFNTHTPQIIFHAAAVKHVPIAQANPLVAIHTNAIGTRHVADAALRYDAERFTLISTDKAVNPCNVMGATKRLAEQYVKALGSSAANQQHTHFVTVRFGNVLASTGSVIPLFQKQLAAGGPLTVTHTDMQRYFMTVREAVELVLLATHISNKAADEQSQPSHQAFAPLYVLDMGEPVRIVELARQLIRLHGLVPDKDVHIAFTGLRPGEKLYEELFYEAENKRHTSASSITQAISPAMALESLQMSLDDLKELCLSHQQDEALQLLASLVPEWTMVE